MLYVCIVLLTKLNKQTMYYPVKKHPLTYMPLVHQAMHGCCCRMPSAPMV